MRKVEAEVDRGLSHFCFQVACLADSVFDKWHKFGLDLGWLEVSEIDGKSLLN